MPNAMLLDVQRSAWGPLREAVEFEREHGPSWELAQAMQDRTRELVHVLSLPDSTQIVERTAEGIRVVS